MSEREQLNLMLDEMPQAMLGYVIAFIQGMNVREPTPKYGSMTPEGKKALEAMKRCQARAEELGIADMTLEEINAEIDAYRRGE